MPTKDTRVESNTTPNATDPHQLLRRVSSASTSLQPGFPLTAHGQLMHPFMQLPFYYGQGLPSFSAASAAPIPAVSIIISFHVWHPHHYCARFDGCFFTSYGLAWSIITGSVSTHRLIAKLALVLNSDYDVRESYSQRQLAVTEIQLTTAASYDRDSNSQRQLAVTEISYSQRQLAMTEIQTQVLMIATSALYR